MADSSYSLFIFTVNYGVLVEDNIDIMSKRGIREILKHQWPDHKQVRKMAMRYIKWNTGSNIVANVGRRGIWN